MIVLPGPFRMSGQVDDDAPNRPPLAVDRQTVRQLQTATELLTKKNYSEAVRNFSASSTSRRTRGSRFPAMAIRNIAAPSNRPPTVSGVLPASARESYETEYRASGPPDARGRHDPRRSGDA